MNHIPFQALQDFDDWRDHLVAADDDETIQASDVEEWKSSKSALSKEYGVYLVIPLTILAK